LIILEQKISLLKKRIKLVTTDFEQNLWYHENKGGFLMSKEEYTVTFHLSNGENVEVSASVDESVGKHDIYLEVIQENEEFYQVIDRQDVYHNISKGHVVDISTYKISDTDLESMNI